MRQRSIFSLAFRNWRLKPGTRAQYLTDRLLDTVTSNDKENAVGKYLIQARCIIQVCAINQCQDAERLVALCCRNKVFCGVSRNIRRTMKMECVLIRRDSLYLFAWIRLCCRPLETKVDRRLVSIEMEELLQGKRPIKSLLAKIVWKARSAYRTLGSDLMETFPENCASTARARMFDWLEQATASSWATRTAYSGLCELDCTFSQNFH